MFHTRPEIIRDIKGADEFGIVEKELTTFEKLYNQGWIRKTGLLSSSPCCGKFTRVTWTIPYSFQPCPIRSAPGERV